MVVYSVLALLLVLFFACYGNTGNVQGALKEALGLIGDTLRGRHLRENYWDITPSQIYFSVRLMAVAIFFAVCLGLGMVVVRTRFRRKGFVQLFETVSSALEVVPEAVYIILIVVLLLFLLQFGIVLPAFPATDPRWRDTWVPALALSLPGAFYLQRIIFLQLRDEGASDYVLTAISKGASRSRTFYRHVLPNVLPTLFRHIPVVTGFVLSSSIFTEFFMEYTGFLFLFTNWATGWDYGTGIPLNGVQKPTGIPEYQPGLVFVIGAALVIIWILIRMLSNLALKAFPAGESLHSPPPNRHRMNKSALIAGSVLMGVVVIIGLFPHLVTNQTPVTKIGELLHYSIDSAQPPSAVHLFGTDDFGRDTFAVAVFSTFQTILPAFGITILIVAISALAAAVWFATNNRVVRWFIQVIGQSLSAVPALFILFLALYVTQLHSRHQVFNYVFWIVLIESGRGAYAYSESLTGWSQYRFLEGAVSVGRGYGSILMTHLRSWLGFFTLEFAFTEFARVLSIMVQLAAFHLYMQEKISFLPFSAPLKGVVSVHSTWLSMIGNSTADMLYIWQPYILYAPVIFLVAVVGGSSLIAKGIRGSAE